MTDHLMNNVLTLGEIEYRLRDRRLQVVSALTEISYPILKRLAEGEHDNYHLKTLVTISEYLQSKTEIDNN